jgi:hypothetical protein
MSGAAIDDLYVIGEHEGAPVVKIGRSGNPAARLASIQTGSPQRLRLLHVEEGAGDMEGEVHKALAGRRVYGEWFDFGADPALGLVRQALADLKVIQEIAARHALRVNLVTTHQPKPRSVATEPDDDPAVREPARSAPTPRDPCEGLSLMQVGTAATVGFFAHHPDPTGYLRSQEVPAHHIVWFYRECPGYGMESSAELLAEAAREVCVPADVYRDVRRGRV